MNSFMSWIGGKKALRELIVTLFPVYYERYIEVFGGGGWVLFHKPPGNDFEVYNDFNSLLVNLYRCVRDKPQELMESLRYVLNAREDFDAVRAALARDSPASDVQKAAWFYQLIRYSYASGLTSFGSQPHDMRSNFPLIEQAHRRLASEPRPIPIEAIIEVKFDLILEYHILRKNGAVLGETIFDDGPVILYDMDERSYKIIAVRKGTILIDERLCEIRSIGRLRFTCAHELAHWVLHKNLYSGTGNIAAYNGQCSTDESDGVIERQADALATALLMPLPQIKKCFYRLRSGRTMEQIVAEMAQIFEVSKQAMQIRLQSHNLM